MLELATNQKVKASNTTTNGPRNVAGSSHKNGRRRIAGDQITNAIIKAKSGHHHAQSMPSPPRLRTARDGISFAQNSRNPTQPSAKEVEPNISAFFIQDSVNLCPVKKIVV